MAREFEASVGGELGVLWKLMDALCYDAVEPGLITKGDKYSAVGGVGFLDGLSSAWGLKNLSLESESLGGFR